MLKVSSQSDVFDEIYSKKAWGSVRPPTSARVNPSLTRSQDSFDPCQMSPSDCNYILISYMIAQLLLSLNKRRLMLAMKPTNQAHARPPYALSCRPCHGIWSEHDMTRLAVHRHGLCTPPVAAWHRLCACGAIRAPATQPADTGGAPQSAGRSDQVPLLPAAAVPRLERTRIRGRSHAGVRRAHERPPQGADRCGAYVTYGQTFVHSYWENTCNNLYIIASFH